jgi:hypothetical protein
MTRQFGTATVAFMGLSLMAGALLVLTPAITVALLACLVATLLVGRPRAALSCWWLVMLLVPFWLQVRIGPVPLPPQSLAVFLVLPTIVFSRSGGNRLGWSLIDTGFVGFLLALLAAQRFGSTTLGVTGGTVIQGSLAYIVGRLLMPAAGTDFTLRLFAISLTGLAIWAILEFVTGVHIFAHLASSAGTQEWGGLSNRAGDTRSEASFGQPIALGATLALAVPFIYVSRYSLRTRLLMLAIVGTGVLTALSRGAVLAAILGLLLVLLFAGSMIDRRSRILLGSTSALIVFMPVLLALGYAVRAGGKRVALSAEHRYLLYEYFPQDVRPLGLARNVIIQTNGHQIWRSFESIDSTFVALGIDFGWIPLLFVAALFLAVGFHIVKRRTSVFQIALFAQLPVLATVALITQYRSLVFFMVGAAAATWNHSRLRAFGPAQTLLPDLGIRANGAGHEELPTSQPASY